MYKKQANKNTGEPKVIELNLSATVAVIIAIIVLIVTVTSVKVITTIIVADENKKLNNDTQAANERVTYVNSTLKDESGNIVNETDADGNVIQVPVPKGYSASKIEGETTASKGFVIYEGDVNWKNILVSSKSSQSNVAIDEPAFDDDLVVINEKLDEPAFPDDLIVINENMPESDNEQDANIDVNTTDATTKDVTTNDTPNNDDITAYTTTPTQEEINIFNLQKTRNQYVWIPVDDPSRIYGVDSKGKILGKIYDYFSSTERTAQNWTETNGIMNLIRQMDYRDTSVFQIDSGYDMDSCSDLNTSGLGETRYEMLAKELEQNYYEVIESIKKYGGFYIGRYETGGLNGTAVVRKMNTNINKADWYTMYKKCLTLKGANTNVKTSMIFGCLWDETLEWLEKSGAIISDGTALTYQSMSNSTKWGNYYSTTFNYIRAYATLPLETEIKEKYKSTIIPSGSAEYTKANNIYDMAGNVLEWTTETSSNYRICRGGYYDQHGDGSQSGYPKTDHPVCRRYYYIMPNAYGIDYRYYGTYLRLS